MLLTRMSTRKATMRTEEDHGIEGEADEWKMGGVVQVTNQGHERLHNNHRITSPTPQEPGVDSIDACMRILPSVVGTAKVKSQSVS